MTRLSKRFDSTAITQATYDSDSRVLDIWYQGGDRYSYFDLPERIYRELCAAPSAGEYVNREIKPRFRAEIEPRRRRFRPE